MSILIIGAQGNMGKRYSAVLKHLGQSVVGVDKEHNRHYIKSEAEKSDGVIICTPTVTHCEWIKHLADIGKPILCEKPFTTNIEELTETLDICAELETNLSMVYQYKMLAPEKSQKGWSYYNYFRHGGDGLVWDCIQIIGLARSTLRLEEDSPIWKCMINGKPLKLGDMDAAYVEFIRGWMLNPGDDLEEIQEIHEKTHEIQKGNPYAKIH